MTRSKRDMHTTGGATKIRGPSSWQEGKQKQRMHARSGAHANKNAQGQLSATRKMERVYDKWSECRKEWSAHSNQCSGFTMPGTGQGTRPGTRQRTRHTAYGTRHTAQGKAHCNAQGKPQDTRHGAVPSELGVRLCCHQLRNHVGSLRVLFQAMLPTWFDRRGAIFPFLWRQRHMKQQIFPNMI